MPIDLTKLTVAPWIVHEDVKSGSVYIPREVGGFPMLLCEQDLDPIDQTALEFAALSRNAFDVMMRRKWAPVFRALRDEWLVDDGHEYICRFKGHGGDGSAFVAADPFTALCAADEWYRENVEATDAGRKM